MKTYLDCWVSSAKSLFSQALAGEPELIEKSTERGGALAGVGYLFSIEGNVRGEFSVALDPLILEAPLLGEGIDQGSAWSELLREVAEAAAGDLLAVSGQACRVSSLRVEEPNGLASRVFELRTAENSWRISIRDDLSSSGVESETLGRSESAVPEAASSSLSPGVELLLDVELEATLRFGCCEMLLGEILELGPGDVVELDRHVADPVDLVVGNKIVAKGDVVLINGNFGLRVTEVAAPQKRLESIRCLF
ncbi:MAG: FliM/FliN family flagellar motor switch protein [Acidobacteria bacterium]|nr:FliM/FliN family flagellar motor switch protein [Acidobacteriota bacterium]